MSDQPNEYARSTLTVPGNGLTYGDCIVVHSFDNGWMSRVRRLLRMKPKMKAARYVVAKTGANTLTIEKDDRT